MTYLLTSLMINLLLTTMLTQLNKKEAWSQNKGSSFECGFMSFYFERMTMSVQYFMVALLFLMLDLEFCILLPFITGKWYMIEVMWGMTMLVTLILASMLYEWKMNELEWKN